jgi:ubiquinone biosynthesis monooxygenase Coq7
MLQHTPERQLTGLDHLLVSADRALRTLTGDTRPALRATPALQVAECSLTQDETARSIGLMRVNHTGEVCAQALYQGQALTAKLPAVREEMERAADEEIDHLAWCEERVKQLGGHLSVLNPLWYGMSFGLGAAAGLIGDKTSLGLCQQLKIKCANTWKNICKRYHPVMKKVARLLKRCWKMKRATAMRHWRRAAHNFRRQLKKG